MNQPTLQELITLSVILRDEAAEYARQEKELRARQAAVNKDIIALLDANGLESGSAGPTTVSIQPKRYPRVTDWDAFYAVVVEKGAPYLLQRRLSTEAIAELAQLEGEIPGVEFYEERALSLTSRRR